jgi:hypothetical protein
MISIKNQIDRYSQDPKDYQHPVFKYYNFPTTVFSPRHNKDYTKYSSQIKHKGGFEYYTPSGWYKYALYVNSPSEVFKPSNCIVYYTSNITSLKEIVTNGSIEPDELINLSQTDEESYLYVTPFIDSLLFSTSPCQVPQDLTFNLGASIAYRVILQFHLPTSSLSPLPNQYPHNYPLPTTVYRVPIKFLTPTSILIKQLS